MNKTLSPSDGCRSKVYFTTNTLSSRTCGRSLYVYGKSSVSRCNHITEWRMKRWSSTLRRATYCDVRTIRRNRFTIWWSSVGIGDHLTGLHFAQSTRPLTASGRNWRSNAGRTAFRYVFECNDGNNRFGFFFLFFFTIAYTVWKIYTKYSRYWHIYKNILNIFQGIFLLK